MFPLAFDANEKGTIRCTQNYFAKVRQPHFHDGNASVLSIAFVERWRDASFLAGSGSFCDGILFGQLKMENKRNQFDSWNFPRKNSLNELLFKRDLFANFIFLLFTLFLLLIRYIVLEYFKAMNSYRRKTLRFCCAKRASFCDDRCKNAIMNTLFNSAATNYYALYQLKRIIITEAKVM